MYSGDFALDLRTTIAALARLPFDGDRICRMIRDTEVQAADNAADSDHTTFWFVLADQFQRRGIVCKDVTSRAVALIDSGADAAQMRSLGMTEAGIRKRTATLAELRARLTSGNVLPRRATVKKPQRLLMNVGDIFAYPTSHGDCFNPYVGPKVKWYEWSQDAWSACIVVDNGLAYDHLAWYRFATIKHELNEKPTIEALAQLPFALRGAGTTSNVHMKRMAFELLGNVVIDRAAIEAAFGVLKAAVSAAVQDVSIGNHLWVVSKEPRMHRFAQGRLETKPELPLRAFASGL